MKQKMLTMKNGEILLQNILAKAANQIAEPVVDALTSHGFNVKGVSSKMVPPNEICDDDPLDYKPLIMAKIDVDGHDLEDANRIQGLPGLIPYDFSTILDVEDGRYIKFLGFDPLSKSVIEISYNTNIHRL